MQAAKSMAIRFLRTPLGKRLLAAQPLQADGLALQALAGGVHSPAAETIAGADYETIAVSVSSSGVVDLALNRPRKLNAINMAVWNDLADAFRRIDNDPNARCVVLRGEGRHFCTGMDLNVFSQMTALSYQETCDARKREMLRKFILRFQEIISMPEKCRVPVIAAVHGHGRP
mmetsp:Transcript_1620/g.4487  ORF Transcript_1620/g.4487 Transcript_1620/m.4487 type:complete len:173 (-) Transcript_1620:108-626(-)